MNHYHLRVFATVARRLSFSRAAEELYISQPAVSRHIRDLERDLKTELFGQTGNRVFLTEAGRLVYRYAQRLFEMEEEMMRGLRELENLERGELRLGAASTPGIYMLPAVVVAFQRRNPGVRVDLSISNSGEVESRLASGELDLGFVDEAGLPGVQVSPYAEDELVFIVPPDHPLADRDSPTLADLEGETILLREEGSGSRGLLEREMERVAFSPSGAMVLNGCEAVKRSVAAGMGIAAVSVYSIQSELATGAVKMIRIPDLKLERVISIVSRKGARPSAASLAFTALARKERPSPAR